jgi:transcriptional regulator with XRE-family HTH domain
MSTPRRQRREVLMLLPAKNQRALDRKIKNSGKTHRQLAAETGWRSHSMLSQLLNGSRNTIKCDAAIRLCLALRCDVYDLFLPVLSSEVQQIADSVAARKAA